jgi:hypothetical protein
MRDWLGGKCHRGTVQGIINKAKKKQRDQEAFHFQNKLLEQLPSNNHNFNV